MTTDCILEGNSNGIDKNFIEGYITAMEILMHSPKFTKASVSAMRRAATFHDTRWFIYNIAFAYLPLSLTYKHANDIRQEIKSNFVRECKDFFT